MPAKNHNQLEQTFLISNAATNESMNQGIHAGVYMELLVQSSP